MGCVGSVFLGVMFATVAVKQWVTSTADSYECGMQALVHHGQQRTADGGDRTGK